MHLDKTLLDLADILDAAINGFDNIDKDIQLSESNTLLLTAIQSKLSILREKVEDIL